MSTIGPEIPGEKFVSEDELKSLLERWVAPQPSKTLDQRIANSYYTELGNAEQAATSAQFPLSQHEVVKMKFCSTCKEEFADKFSFCPVDGTPLNVLVPEPEEIVVAPPVAALPAKTHPEAFCKADGRCFPRVVSLQAGSRKSRAVWPGKRQPRLRPAATSG